MIRVFAKVNSKEKAIGFCFEADLRSYIKWLNETQGGSWVFCDNLRKQEVLIFEDKKFYQGYSTLIDRYSPGIKKVEKA